MKDNNEILKNIEFEKLSFASLARYKCYFNIDIDSKDIDNKQVLAKEIALHFSKMEVNPKEVIDNFMQIEKDLSILNNSTTRKSIRHQEKIEKSNISKILDNYKKYE